MRKVVRKSARDSPERYCGWFWIHCYSKKFERMTREATDVCLQVLKESNKSSFDSYSVRNSVLIISHITFRDCRVHIKFLSDNLPWNSCILVQVFRWPFCFPVQSFEVNFHTENMAARAGNGQGNNFFKVNEKSGNFTLNKGTLKSLKEFREILRVHTVFYSFSSTFTVF